MVFVSTVEKWGIEDNYVDSVWSTREKASKRAEQLTDMFEKSPVINQFTVEIIEDIVDQYEGNL